MDNYDEQTERNTIILWLMEIILGMTDAERLDLLQKLKEVPIKELSLGDRNDSRKSYDQTITFSTRDRQYRAICKDISSGGVFIMTEEVFQLGQLVTLEIPFSNGKRNISVPAEIVRVNTEGIGLRFMKKDDITYV